MRERTIEGLPDRVSVRRMHVERVEYSDTDDEGNRTAGSHIEPALDHQWPSLTRVSWLLGVLYVDHGIDVEAWRYPTNWCLVIDGTKTVSGPVAGGWLNAEIDELWGTLHTLATGYSAGRARGEHDAAVDPARPRRQWSEEWGLRTAVGREPVAWTRDEAAVRKVADESGYEVVHRYVTTAETVEG